MRTIFLALILVTAPLFSCCAIVPKIEQSVKIVGTYQRENGSLIKITNGELDHEYRISGIDNGKFHWTSIGFFNPECDCIKSVFQYQSHKQKYGDSVGVHRFIFQNNDKVLVKLGGWKKTGEFRKQTYSRL